ncbi:hypothetical protein CCHR01_18544 [Colletotrichum chrysophilum]|uniref:Uncharacterized protein n=1 Tax=Colletotrichum chrysophilum TaxID=1836956 RepID=A0AAD9E8U2_9PEZI|nr:hypothetical protein CCHR01_18544 [Colletotrichum chrysophilum]
MNAPQRQSNLERARWRSKCRQRLAEHIVEDRVGLTLDPSQVRLHPSTDDGYCWKVLNDAHNYLFDKKKNLSDQSIGIYKDLYNLCGEVFEAVPREQVSAVSETTFPQIPAKATSFTARIRELEVQNDYLSQQTSLIKSQLDSEVRLRLEQKEELELSYQRLQAVLEDLKKANLRASFLEKSAMKCSQGMSKLRPIIDDIQQSCIFNQDGFL